MRNEETLRKLNEMKFGGMVESYVNQAEDPIFKEMDFDKRFEMIIDHEYAKRRSNRITRLLRQAQFSNPEASMEDIEYHPDRRLDKELIQELSIGTYLLKNRNIIIMGASVNGKTWLVNAFDVQACRQYNKVHYCRLPDLLDEFLVAKANADGSYAKLKVKYQSFKLLIIDEWLLTPPSEDQVRMIFEIIESRMEKGSTIICSQISPEGWYERLGPELIADAIMDRIKNNSYQLLLDGSVSMRERHGITRNLRDDE